MSFVSRVSVVFLLMFCTAGLHAQPQNSYSVGDQVVLRTQNRGIPIHRLEGKVSMFDRLDPGSGVNILAAGTAEHSHWFQVEQGSVRGWMVASYFAGLASKKSVAGMAASG